MTFFKRQSEPVSVQPPKLAPRPQERGARGPNGYTMPVPEHRKGAGSSLVKVERDPRGCLFKVSERAWFDLDGYFCVFKRRDVIEVTRGSQKSVMATLTKHQRRELEKARLNARRRGVR